MNASIFWRNFSCLDHAYIDSSGLIHGHSYHVTATITGKPTEDESVVLDFSSGKKRMKEIIDDNEDGYDHKLIIFQDSHCSIKKLVNNKISIESPYLFISCPEDAVKIVPEYRFNFNKHIERSLLYKLGDSNIESIKIELSEEGFSKFSNYFNYSHGLKSSSSFGCKSPVHGHFSFVELDKDLTLQEEIAEYLNDKVMIYRDNVVEEGRDFIRIGYTCDRGAFTVLYHHPHKWLIYDTETTIEFMINHVVDKFRERLKGKTIRISEGLQKGAEVIC